MCARFGVGTSCGMPPTFFRHTKVMSKFLQHITKLTSQGPGTGGESWYSAEGPWNSWNSFWNSLPNTLRLR